MTPDEMIEMIKKHDKVLEVLSKELNELKELHKATVNNFNSKKEYTNATNNEISIIFKRYKKSILVKNKYNDKNTTVKCKDILKELEAKWSKQETGWIFVGKFDESLSLEENSKFIIDKLLMNNFEIDYEFENET